MSRISAQVKTERPVRNEWMQGNLWETWQRKALGDPKPGENSGLTKRGRSGRCGEIRTLEYLVESHTRTEWDIKGLRSAGLDFGESHRSK